MPSPFRAPPRARRTACPWAPAEVSVALALACSVPWRTRSAGFVGQVVPKYPFVDHSMRDMEIGAVGLLDATP